MHLCRAISALTSARIEGKRSVVFRICKSLVYLTISLRSWRCLFLLQRGVFPEHSNFTGYVRLQDWVEDVSRASNGRSVALLASIEKILHAFEYSIHNGYMIYVEVSFERARFRAPVPSTLLLALYKVQLEFGIESTFTPWTKYNRWRLNIQMKLSKVGQRNLEESITNEQ